jgi:Phosphotransferase enzyme family
MRQTVTPGDPALGSAAVDADLQEAARVYFPDLTDLQAVTGHPSLARVETPSGISRVRRWPEATPRRDVVFSHDVVHRAREAGLSIAPEMVTPQSDSQPVLHLGGRLYDAQRWLPGVSAPRSAVAWPDPEVSLDLPTALAPQVFAAVLSGTARLHEATRVMASDRDAPAAPLALLPGAVREAHGRHVRSLRARARREPAVQRWLATSERLLAAAEPIVATASWEQELLSSPLHLGLWPSHVLFDADRLSGLLGWERVAVGSPMLDVAQAILRLQGWSDEAVETALASYSQMRELAPNERRLLPAVAALDAIATTGRLLEQSFARPDIGRPPAAVRAAIDLMLGSMTALERDLVELETAGKSRRTPWRRTARPISRACGGKPYVRRG